MDLRMTASFNFSLWGTLMINISMLNVIWFYVYQVFDGRLICVEIAKPGKDRGYPKTSGPPSTKLHSQETDDVADCWY